VTAAHAVSPDDEARHRPDPDALWNESYYADFVQADGSWGGWLRLGLYPNRQVAWWTTWIVHPDRPGICSVGYHLPVPDGEGLVVEDAGTRVEIDLIRPLSAFRIAASAPAEVVSLPADVYGSGLGTAAQLAVDLTWTTDGTPYHYDLTTRYEIPCTVTGSVTIDGVTMEVDGQGQRDHSWGVRDWWAFGWCWSSARLDDGTRVHLADIRMPGFPIAFGYVQLPSSHPRAGVHPVTGLTVTESLAEYGLPSAARILISTETGAGDLAMDVSPVAFGPVLLRNDDGRTSRFPRALARFVVEDGRQGMGWIEWNQPDAVA
jgi:hypothetical protein